jgi:hypothetical protein
MNTKHTQGPWNVRRQNPSPTTGEWMIAGAKPGYLAEVRNCGSGDVEANARLIAAAPDMYEQHKLNRRCRDIVDNLLAEAGYAEDSSVRHQLACMNFDAIAKAEGKT